MKTQTKDILIDLARFTWVVSVAAFFTWSYKQNQIDDLKAEHRRELKAKEHELDRARAMADADKGKEVDTELWTHITISAKDLRSAKKARKVMEEVLAEMKEKQSHTHTL